MSSNTVRVHLDIQECYEKLSVLNWLCLKNPEISDDVDGDMAELRYKVNQLSEDISKVFHKHVKGGALKKNDKARTG